MPQDLLGELGRGDDDCRDGGEPEGEDGAEAVRQLGEGLVGVRAEGEEVPKERERGRARWQGAGGQSSPAVKESEKETREGTEEGEQCHSGWWS